MEFKREYSSSLLKSIAAMANTYGGMILVGVNDRAADGEDRVVGVDAQSALDQIVSGCYEKFDPPWEPKFIPVPLDDGSGRSVIVIKIDPNAAPRPLLMDMKAPIRLSGRNASADRDRLLTLACEDRLAEAVPMGQHVTSPQIPQGNDGSPTADFIFRTGINVPIGEAAAWRPLTERTLATLTKALNESLRAPCWASATARSTASITSGEPGSTGPAELGSPGTPAARNRRDSRWRPW
ncbi:helix-turn-helix domain-containing protein [Streptomyces sp. NPDC059340]|uniref:AlbA family DNA-binding domain-containing protein n=1 Tax=Streptomyces sp. NPDC059340 TaxID=3346806 RepID=UPI0036AF1EA5